MPWETPIDTLLHQALLQTLALPFALALALALAAWRLGAAHAGGAVALGLTAGLLAGQAAVAGWPALPPHGAIDKLPWLAVGGGLIGLAGGKLDARRRSLVLAGGIAAALLWIGAPRLLVPHAQAWVAALLVGACAFWALRRLADAGSAGGALLLVTGAVAAAGVAAYGASYAMAQVIAVLAAGLAGAMAGAGAAPGGLGAAGRLAAAGPLLGLVAILALYTQAAPLALLLLLPVFLAEAALRRIGGLAELAERAGSIAGAVRLGLLFALAAMPAAAAVAVAVWRSGPLYM